VQQLCADSAPAAETIALHLAAKEAVPVSEMVGSTCAATLYTDSKTALEAERKRFSKRMAAYAKSMETKIGFVQGLEDAGILRLEKVAGIHNVADMFTKLMSRHSFNKCRTNANFVTMTELKERGFIFANWSDGDKMESAKEVEHAWSKARINTQCPKGSVKVNNVVMNDVNTIEESIVIHSADTDINTLIHACAPISCSQVVSI
jgi:hypothetical protein